MKTKTKNRTGIRQAVKKYIFAIQNEIDLSHDEFSEPEIRNESVNIQIKNGYWQINEKPLHKCSIAKQTFFDQYLKMKFVKLPVAEESSFKNRSAQIKEKYNHRFKLDHTSDDLLNSYPDIGKLEFIKVTNPNLFKTKTA
jgi:hypothetical protein